MSKKRQELIRNFSIIAHIDHGKSTLADRLIEKTGMLTQREMQDQILDSMDFIDTPGHVDFTYEVSRSLAACEGAVLVVDASQGVEAQTLANVYLADSEGLEIVPVLNKIDLPGARPEEVKTEIEDLVGVIAENAPLISAKDGINIESVLEAIVKDVPAPTGDENAPLKALIFDSYYDPYKGAVADIRVIDGSVKKGDVIQMMSSGKSFEVVEVGVFLPKPTPMKQLQAGDVGYITAAIKNVRDCQVGDTITFKNNPTPEPLEGYKKATPMVYCGIYPAEGESYEIIRDALEKLQLNDAALSFEPETSVALGFGFRCGFLGLLHLEIIQQRIEREFDLDIIATAPGVIYRVTKTDGTVLFVQNPSDLPSQTEITMMEEPIVASQIICPHDYVGNVMEICQNRRGVMISMDYIDEKRVLLKYDLPLNEVIYDFFDALKSKTRGYGSLDYEFKEYRESELVKMDILLNKEVIDAFCMIVHKSKAVARGRMICERLKKVIPRQQFMIPIQAAIGNSIIARENISALRKDVLAKCYGGDISRKKKLLEKQKEGKKRMRQMGSVEVPQQAFLSVLKFEE